MPTIRQTSPLRQRTLSLPPPPKGREQTRPGYLDRLLEILERRGRIRKPKTFLSASRVDNTNSRDISDIPRISKQAFLVSVTTLEDKEPPQSYEEAINRLDGDEQRKAFRTEIQLYDKNSTQSYRPRQDVKKKVLRGRQVCTIKKDANRTISRRKARQVVKGFTQKEGVDYTETYAAVVKPTSLRALFGIYAEQDLKCYQYDIVAAFLNALIDDYKVYVELPYGFEDEHPRMVCLLLKALYSLKQAPLLQYTEFTAFIKKNGFNPFLSDAYIFRNSGGTIIVVYVDNLLIFVRLLAIVKEAANLIAGTFDIRSLGELHYYLRIRIMRDRSKRQLIITQDSYIDKIARKFA